MVYSYKKADREGLRETLNHNPWEFVISSSDLNDSVTKFKANAKENVENYRSISLLSILGKCQERIVHRVVYSHVSPFLNGWQHGFVKGRSCITQLVLTHHMWHKALDDGLQVCLLYTSPSPRDLSTSRMPSSA